MTQKHSQLPAATVRMAQLLREQVKAESLVPSALPGVQYMRTDRCHASRPMIYDPGICILASGRKIVRIGGQQFVYDADRFLVLGVPLPVECEVLASAEEPILGIRIDVDPVVLGELLLDVAESQPATQTAPQGIYSTQMPDAMRSACLRLVEAFASPADARILGPSIVREIFYRVLSTEQGGALRAVATQHARFAQISKALRRIHSHFNEDLSVESLAESVFMSVSTFHENFKAVTSTSPLQYIKTVRLHRARSLMVQEGVGAAEAAGRVGYESPSQFSREFKRLFGATPSEEAERTRAAVGAA